jgi:hypothetical protein
MRFTLAGLMSVGVLLAACNGADRAMTPEGLSQRVGFALPEGTRVVRATPNAGREGLVRAKLEMSPAAVSRLLAVTQIPKLRVGDADRLGPDHDYWDPHRAAQLRFGSARLPDSRSVVVGLDEARPDVTVVYLMVHGT